MRIPEPNEFLTLASFLSDPNPSTQELTRQHLKTILHQHPTYQELLETIQEPALMKPIHGLLEECRFDLLEASFRELGQSSGEIDLERGMILLASTAYPKVRASEIHTHLDNIAEELSIILDAQEPSDREAVELVRHFLFQEKRFRGNERHFYDPDNSFINRVLERRLGIPISLSCIYLLISERLDLPVHGVGLPGHFIVAHELPHQIVYLDPFHEGRILSLDDCEKLVRRQGVSLRKEFLAFTPKKQILSRMMVNVINIYSEQGELRKHQALSRCLQALQGVDAE